MTEQELQDAIEHIAVFDASIARVLAELARRIDECKCKHQKSCGGQCEDLRNFHRGA
jgi:hypothetical protein